MRVVQLGFVGDDTLAALYRTCVVLAFPSRYEGFGLPLLEAMSYGAPVVAANASSVPEAGGDAACYVPVGDEAALADAILRITPIPFRGRLRARGRARAADSHGSDGGAHARRYRKRAERRRADHEGLERFVKGRNALRSAARDQVTIDDDVAVDPFGFRRCACRPRSSASSST